MTNTGSSTRGGALAVAGASANDPFKRTLPRFFFPGSFLGVQHGSQTECIMTLSNKRFPFLPPANSKRTSTSPANRSTRPSAWISAAGVAAVVAALWLAFDLPAQDPRSFVASLTPVAALKCISTRILAAECVATVNTPVKAEQTQTR